MMEIDAGLFREDVPLGRVIILPSVGAFSLYITSYGPGCEVATYIPCPFPKDVEFAQRLQWAGDDVPKVIYPPPATWNAIFHQYTKGTVEQVVPEMTMDKGIHVDCSITFRSSDRATLKLRYIHYTAEVEYEMEAILAEKLPCILSQAFQTIRDHPLLANVKHLYIRGENPIAENLELVANAVGRLLGSMGPLEDLTLEDCNLRPYLNAFLDTP
jgi:hypothetical protein